MSTVGTPPKVTPEELLTMPDGVNYELVNGELVERNMGFQCSRIGTTITRLVGNYVEAHHLGWVLGADASYQCFPDDIDKVRKSNVSFVSFDCLAPADEPVGHCLVAPKLVVEVAAPTDTVFELSKNVDDFLEAGTEVVWLVNPCKQTVDVLRPDGSLRRLRADDEISGDDVLPGFRCLVRDFFATQGAAESTKAQP
ncbi:MAG: Uma2 family endonuclease [Planctomycetales bacterium]|nr:Uma2 family endonuclease [Planctomycetales bacterium]